MEKKQKMGKKVAQSDLREMMQKMKAEKGQSVSKDSRLKKYKLSSKELALLEMEKKRKADEEISRKQKFAKKAGVPEHFFDSAKTKAFLNLKKEPQKSILKNKGTPSVQVPAASSKATGKEWTSSAPVLSCDVSPKEKTSKAHKVKDKSPKPTLLRTPSGGAIGHDSEEDDVPDDKDTNEDQALPEGFFDDPVKDAKARGIEYKDPEEEEWESWKKEIAVEVVKSADMQAEEQLGETVERQIEEIDEQMNAWSRVIEIEKKKDVVDEQVKTKKVDSNPGKDDVQENSDDEIGDEEDLEELFDWRKKKS